MTFEHKQYSYDTHDIIISNQKPHLCLALFSRSSYLVPLLFFIDLLFRLLVKRVCVHSLYSKGYENNDQVDNAETKTDNLTK